MKDSKKIEAYGVRGMNSRSWRKTFKNQDSFEIWLDKNEGDVEVRGTREVEPWDAAQFPEPFTPYYGKTTVKI